MRVTRVERPPRRRLATLHLDGRPALVLSLEVLAQSGLRPGDEITPLRLEQLRQAEARHTALAAAMRLISQRPRSEAELRQRLRRRRLPDHILDETVARLRELGLVDDDAFARSWVESRDQRSPRSRRLLAAELRARGVPREAARRSLSGLDDEDAAYRAAARRAAALADLPYADFRRRLSDLLLRRGFGYEVTRGAVARLWQELIDGQPPADDE